MIYEAHEYANLFPMMLDDDFSQLKTSMSESGYDESLPIVLFNGLILDGRNRYKAANELSITPLFTDFTGTDEQALSFVLRHNLNRRHLNASQKAALAVKLLPIFDGYKKEKRIDADKWILNARLNFKELIGDKENCCVCGKYKAITEAHHVYPLARQYSDGVVEPIQDFVWLCPTHHVIAHRFISILEKNEINYSELELTDSEFELISDICASFFKMALKQKTGKK